ncbi:MAG: hypothetical protein K8R90_02365 [Candidatus Cloacimonetes bacterium]|nr:hypothetical protein [Candidatus Cloacimonadota bacterium]
MKNLIAIVCVLAISVAAFAVGNEVEAFLKVFEDMDTLANNDVKDADTPAKQAAVITAFDSLLAELEETAGALEEAYPDWDEDDLPPGIEDFESITERFMLSFFAIYAVGADNMEEPVVAAAYEKLDERLESIMMSGDEDSW